MHTNAIRCSECDRFPGDCQGHRGTAKRAHDQEPITYYELGWQGSLSRDEFELIVAVLTDVKHFLGQPELTDDDTSSQNVARVDRLLTKLQREGN